MKKIINKSLIFILLFVFILVIVGCANSKVQLDTPSVVINGNVIQWTEVEGAKGYQLTIGNNTYNVDDNQYVITGLSDGKYDVSIKALGSGEVLDSKASSVISYNYVTAKTRISAPTISFDGYQIMWEAIDNAISYDVYFGIEKTNTTNTRMEIKDLESGKAIFVIAIAATGYTNSVASNIIKYNKQSSEIKTGVDYYQTVLLDNIDADLSGAIGDTLDLVNSRQLYDTSLWSRFVCQFRSNTDGDGYGWRGEFWGKMMEGACITYTSLKDEKLYKILENTTEDLLTTEQADGSITSYGNPTTDEETDVFCGWDMWCRRWTLQGLMSFYKICKNEDLKNRILASVCRQLDCILEHVGDGEGKMNINDACSQWGGLPTSSILEVVCKIYEATGKQEYFDFATHIVNNGGSKYGNQIEQAIENKTLPYTWGAPKAGELCNFFDGVLEYYFITGIEKYKIAAVNFWYAVNESEITIVGGGCTKDEVFEHSAVEQADPTKTGAQQEFCVTIHWLNFSQDIYQVTKDPAVIDSMEITIYNAVLCCVDNEGYYDHVFNSYNNLIYNKRVTSAAGGMSLHEPYEWAYGCCISQGSIATGLIPQIQFSTSLNEFSVNLYLPGKTTGTLDSGSKIGVETVTGYPNDNTVNMTLALDFDETFALSLRIPAWSKNTIVKVNGVAKEGIIAGSFYNINRTWKNGDQITVEFQMDVVEIWGSEDCAYENGKNMVALRRGPITLARDARLDNGEIFDTVEFVKNADGTVKYTISNTASFENIIEIEVELTSGKKIHLVDYGHAGKTFNWDSMFTTFMPTTDYWMVDFTNPNGVIMINNYFDSVIVEDESDGYIRVGNAISDYTDLTKFAFVFENAGEGYYYIKNKSTGKYFTCVSVGNKFFFRYEDFNGSNTQMFKVDHCGLLSYTLTCKITTYIVSIDTETNPINLYSNCGSSKQYWSFILVDDSD